MNFEDEPYVRLFIRRTLNNKRLRWEGRAVLHEMLYVFDRAGVFEFDGDLADAVETMTELPQRVVAAGLKRLVDSKTWVVRAGVLFWPNYLKAQTTNRSDKARQQESRQRRRDTAHAETLLGPDAPEPVVTGRDDESQGVTPDPEIVTIGHAESRDVTLSLAQPSLDEADPRGEKTPPTPSEPEPVRPPPRDPFMDTLRKRPPGKRADVLRTWDAFKLALGYPLKTKFRGDWDQDAIRIADALDAYDLETCLAVVEQAPRDGMVNGTADENKQKHDTVAYVFENQNTFNRLLRAAEVATKKARAAGGLERSMTAEPDLTDYDQEAPCPQQ